MTRLPAASIPPDLVRSLPMELVFDAMGTRLNPDKAAGKKMALNWLITDAQGKVQRYVTRVENSALTHSSGRQDSAADATITLARSTWDAITLRQLAMADAFQSGRVKIDGNGAKLQELFGILDEFSPMFEVIEPRAAAAVKP